jgi:hypothetical protein
MISKLTLSLITAVGLSVAASTVARADPMAGSGEGREQSLPQRNDALNAAEQENPDSPDFKDRKLSSRQPTSDEIDAAEAGNPDSVDFKDRMISNHKTTNAELNAGETGNPHAVENAIP